MARNKKKKTILQGGTRHLRGTYDIVRRTRDENGDYARTTVASVKCGTRKEAKRIAAKYRQPGDLGAPTANLRGE